MYLIKSNSSKKKGEKYNSLILAQFYISITLKNNRKPKTFSDIFRDYRNRKLKLRWVKPLNYNSANTL